MIELVWDAERTGTALGPSGAMVRVGDDANFSPDDLLAMAVAACLMRTFLALAAERRVPILSYTSTAAIDAIERSAGGPRVVVRSYIVASSTEDRAPLQALFEQASRTSNVCGLLGNRVACEAGVQVIAGACATS